MGIIKYLDNDPNILVRSSLKTDEQITTVGANSIIEAGATLDQIFGGKAGANGICRFTGFAGSLGLDSRGQVSFNVPTLSISKIWSATGSLGTVYGGDTYIYSHGQTSVPYGRMWINASNDMSFEMNTVDTHIPSIQLHSLGQNVNSRITLSWDNDVANTVDVRINNILYGSGVRTDLTAPMFNNVFMASNRSGAGGTIAMQNSFFSDVLIAATPAVLDLSQLLVNLSYFGDSHVSQADQSGAVGYYKNNARYVVDGVMAAAGILTSGTVDGHSGATVRDGSATPLESFRAAYIATNPEPTVFQCGTNDCLEATLNASFQADQDDHIATILASTPYGIPLFIGSTPTVKYATGADIPQKVANVAEANAITKGAPARWDTANPLDKGRVVFYDLFNYLGGENPPPDVFEGQRTGLNDNVHLSAKGQLMWGQLLGQTVYNTLLNNATSKGNSIRSPIRIC